MMAGALQNLQPAELVAVAKLPKKEVLVGMLLAASHSRRLYLERGLVKP